MRRCLLGTLVLAIARTVVGNDVWIVETGTHYATIQAAIDAATAGQTVQVAAGTYNEAVTVAKRLTLQEAGDSTVIVGGGSAGINITVGGDTPTERLVIRDLKASNGAYGVYTNSTVGHITLENVTCTDNVNRGLEFHNSSNVTDVQVVNCDLSGNLNAGMRARGNVDGLVVAGGHMDNNTYGFYSVYTSGTPTLTNVTIDGTTFNGNKEIGIYLEKLSNAVLQNIEISDSGTVSPTYPAGLTMSIFGGPAQNIQINNARVLDCGTANAADGRGLSIGAYGAGSIANMSMNCAVITGCPTAVTTWGSGASLQMYNSAIVGNVFGVRNGASAPIDAENNWWGTADGGAIGAMVSGSVDYTPWLTKPPVCQVNVLYLEATPASIYIKPTETVFVDLNVANLLQEVTGMQALLNFSSTYFKSGGGEVGVAPGGGVWNELIYDVWTSSGDLDVAVGVDLETTGGTQADATTAKFTLIPTGTEGVTRMVFRADGENGYATMLSDTAHQPVWPSKLNSTNICIDGTPPNEFAVTPSTTCTRTDVTLTFSTTDGLSGMDHYELLLDTVSQGTVTSPHVLDMSGQADGAHQIVIRAWDRAGNTRDASVSVSVDKTGPTVTSAAASPTCVKDEDVTITAAATDTGCAGGTITWEYRVGIDGTWKPGLTVLAAELAEGSNTLYARATDGLANTGTPFEVSTPVSKDTTPPVIASITATQNGGNVLCPDLASQGVVDIYVTLADDGGCAALQEPTVIVDGISPTMSLGGSGNTWQYQVTVTSTTANGTHTITVTTSDSNGNTATDDSEAVCVDKNQAVGSVSLVTLSSASYSFTRDVVFVATDSSGTVVKTWTIAVAFTNNTVNQIASGTYVLLNAPGTMANLSAKTAWHLRKRQAVALDGDGQATADFTLLGGDLDDTNYVNILDYSILKSYWNSTDPLGDINGDGQVQLLDYSIMKSNWFKPGDPE